MASTTLLDVRLRPEMAELDRMADLVHGLAAHHGWSPDLLNKMQLCIEELVSNCIRHGRALGPCSFIDVEIGIDAATLAVRITDDAPAFDPLSASAPSLDVPLDQRQIGGAGVFLVRRLTDSMVYERKGERNIVTLHTRI